MTGRGDRRIAANYEVIYKWMHDRKLSRKAKHPLEAKAAKKKDFRKASYRIPISKVVLNSRIMLRLKDMNVRTLGDITRFGVKDFIGAPNIGIKSFRDLEKLLQAYDLNFAKDEDHSPDIFRQYGHVFLITPEAMTTWEEKLIMEAIKFEYREIVTKLGAKP